MLVRTSLLQELKFLQSIQPSACRLQLPTKAYLMSASCDSTFCNAEGPKGAQLALRKCLVSNGESVKQKTLQKKPQPVLRNFKRLKNILNLIRKKKFACFSRFIHCAGKEHICCHIHILQALFFPKPSYLRFEL